MSELEEKTNRLRRMLESERLAGVLLNTQHNFSWLSCGGSNGIDLSQGNGAGFLFVTANGKRYLIANNIEKSRLLEEELSETDFEPIEISWQSEKDPMTVINAVRSLGVAGELGCDIGFPETRWIEPSIGGCRFELTGEETDRYRELGRDAGEVFRSIIPRLQSGQTENAIARIVRDEFGAREIYPVVTLVGADDRISKYRHPLPTDNAWTDTLLIVVCGRRRGLIANLTRIICAGEIPSDLLRRTEATAAVNAALYAGTRVGATSSELYAIAAKAYADQGFAEEIDKHHQGGACGYRTRDWVANPEGSDVVRHNQAFAWNPSITGTKTEETGILINGEFEVITATEGVPKISTVVGGREYFSPGIISLSKGVTT